MSAIASQDVCAPSVGGRRANGPARRSGSDPMPGLCGRLVGQTAVLLTVWLTVWLCGMLGARSCSRPPADRGPDAAAAPDADASDASDDGDGETSRAARSPLAASGGGR